MNGRAAPVDIADVVAGLTARIGPLCHELFPAGVREGHEFRVGSPAGEKGRSMAVNLGPAKAGVWRDFSGGQGGDALDLVSHALFGGDKKQGLAWAKKWLGLDSPLTEAERRRIDERRAAAAAKAATARKADDERTAKGIRAIWLGARADLRGTPADDYLRSRGIFLSQLGRQPGALRFHDGLYESDSKKYFPAIVAGVTAPDGEMCAVHRTYLAFWTAGGWHVKAGEVHPEIRDSKKSWGPLRGGSIPIWRGETGRPIRHKDPGPAVTVTEGIEDALTVALADPARRVVCGVSLANIAALWLPDAIKDVTIHAHNGDGPEATRALERAIAFHQAAGRTVRLARAPAGVKDFNDVVRGA